MLSRGDLAVMVLGAEVGSNVPLLDGLVATLDGFRYEFRPISEFEEALSKDLRRAMQIYWTEILYRAHWAACTALIRAQRWISGVLEAHASGNVLVFAACCRGFIEAAADTNDALNPVPYTLAANHRTVRAAVAGCLESRVLAQEVEDRLIHFTHARKPRPGEELPPLHKVKTVAEYLKKIERQDSKVGECYRSLCDMTHPGASSVLAFATCDTDEAVLLRQASEQVALEHVRQQVVDAAPTVMALGVTTCVLMLKTLNSLDVPDVRTPFADQVGLDGIPAWEKIRESLAAGEPPPGQLVQ